MRNLKSIIHGFKRKPTTSIINLLGLSVSLALVIVLSAYCYSELTTDSHHENANRVYMFVRANDAVSTPAILKEEINEKLPNVEKVVRIGDTWNPPIFQVNENEPFESSLIFADKEFFDLFTYEAKEGNLATSLNEPMSVVITEKLANRIFGREPAIGNVIKMNNRHSLTVSAVLKNPTNKTFLDFAALTSNETRKKIQPNGEEFTSWGYGNFLTYVLLSEHAEPLDEAKSIYTLYPEDSRERTEERWEVTPQLIPLKDFYFSTLGLGWMDYFKQESKQKVLSLMMVAALVLLIALFNFINISTFQWYDKLKQTGTMKVFGADRFIIMKRIFSESIFMFLVSFLLSILFVKIFMAIIQNLTGIQVNNTLVFTPSFMSIALMAILVLCLIVSVLPALRISTSKAINNLHNTLNEKQQKKSLISILVGIQFTIAIVLIAFTLLVNKQIRFGSSQLGYDEELNLSIHMTNQLHQKKEVLKDYIKTNPNIEKYSFNRFYPNRSTSNWGEVKIETDGVEKKISFNIISSDATMFDILNLEFIAGNTYSDKPITNKRYDIVVNETFVNQYGITNPVGFEIDVWGSEHFTIVGVVKDFHYKAVNEKIQPLIIANKGWDAFCLLQLSSNDFNTVHSTIKDIEKFTAELSPAFPVEITFLDQAVDEMYKTEVQFRRTFTLFALAAIFICMLGVFAMSLFACQKRTKEIGVRKVNGATIFEVIKLLNYKFVIQVFAALIIACPLAYFVMGKWLESFAYKTQISWWIFAIAGLSALFIAIITVTLQSWKVANRNPVEALRFE